MLKNKTRKIFIILLSIACLMSFAYADTTPVPNRVGSINLVGQSLTGLSGSFSEILGAIQWIGLVLAVAMVLFCGIKYMTSVSGKKAEAKQTIIPVLIGAAILAIAPILVNWIFNDVFGK